VTVADADLIESMMADVEAEVIAAGASPASVEVRFEEVPERSTVRAVATGAVGLLAGALPGRSELDDETIRARVPAGGEVEAKGRFWLITTPSKHGDSRFGVLDRYGDEVIDIEGERADGASLATVFEQAIRYRGPVTLRPTVWIIDGRRLIELASIDPAANPFAGRDDVAYLVGRER
jgi:hypothetical protein